MTSFSAHQNKPQTGIILTIQLLQLYVSPPTVTVMSFAVNPHSPDFLGSRKCILSLPKYLLDILVTVRLGIVGNAANVGTDIIRDSIIKRGKCGVKKTVMECFEIKLIKYKMQKCNITVKAHNTTAFAVCTCVNSMFGVGRFEELKQQELCSWQICFKICLRFPGFFLRSEDHNQHKRWTDIWKGTEGGVEKSV